MAESYRISKLAEENGGDVTSAAKETTRLLIRVMRLCDERDPFLQEDGRDERERLALILSSTKLLQQYIQCFRNLVSEGVIKIPDDYKGPCGVDTDAAIEMMEYGAERRSLIAKLSADEGTLLYLGDEWLMSANEAILEKLGSFFNSQEVNCSNERYRALAEKIPTEMWANMNNGKWSVLAGLPFEVVQTELEDEDVVGLLEAGTGSSSKLLTILQTKPQIMRNLHPSVWLCASGLQDIGENGPVLKK